MEKDIPYKWKFLKSLATTFTSGKLDFKTKSIRKANKGIISVQFTSVSQSCPTLCGPMNRSTPGFPVHHHLPEFTQTHIHWVSDAIQPSHPLSSPSSPAANPSRHQSLFQWVKGFGIANKAEIDVFSGTLLLFDDPVEYYSISNGILLAIKKN